MPKKSTKLTTKEKLINAEKERLRAIFTDMDENDMKHFEPLIQNTAFINATIDELQTLINKTGYVQEYDNGGGQKGVKESEYVKKHVTYSKLQLANVKAMNKKYKGRPIGRPRTIISFNNLRPPQHTRTHISHEHKNMQCTVNGRSAECLSLRRYRRGFERIVVAFG